MKSSSWAAMVYRTVFKNTLTISGCLRTPRSKLQWFRVCHLAICNMRSGTSRGEAKKSSTQGKLFHSSFDVRCPLQLHLATVKHGLHPYPCTVVLDFKIYFRWRKYIRSSIQCTLISSYELKQVLNSVIKKSVNFSSMFLSRRKTCLQNPVSNESLLSAVLSI